MLGVKFETKKMVLSFSSFMKYVPPEMKRCNRPCSKGRWAAPFDFLGFFRPRGALYRQVPGGTWACTSAQQKRATSFPFVLLVWRLWQHGRS